MKKYVIGIDLGGTNCRFGVVTADGKLLKQEIVPTSKDRTQEGIVNFLSGQIERLKSEYPDVAGVGIGAPGIVDFERGVIVKSPHYSDWKGFPLKTDLSKAAGLPVILDNDGNMIARGEGWQGAGKGLKNFVMMTLGTGIGGGIVINGEVFHGDLGFAGEIGHIVINFNGKVCECGGRGCWENIVSSEGVRYLMSKSDDPNKEKFLEQFNGEVDKVSAKKLHAMAEDGDIFASGIWRNFGAYLGAGIASLVNVLGINTFIIGGGLSSAWNFFIAEAKREIPKRTYKETAALIDLKRAALGEAAGIIGAAKQAITLVFKEDK